MTNKTIRYSRSLAEAFPEERASFTEGWQRSNVDRAVTWACALGLLAVLLSICFVGAP